MPDRQRQVCVEGALNAHLSQPGDSSRPGTDWKIGPKRGHERFSDMSPHLSGGQRQQSDAQDRLAGGWTPAADPLPAVGVRSPARPSRCQPNAALSAADQRGTPASPKSQ